MRPSHRDSDASHASYASNRRSTASLGFGGGGAAARHPPNITDAAFKQAAVRRVNAYLSSHNFQFTLNLKPLPSAREITETLRFILSRLEFHSTKLEDDIPVLLKQLNCPLKLNRSAFKAPGTPHAFPHLLAVIHWLVQIADFKDDLSSLPEESEETRRLYEDLDPVTAHALRSYRHFMCGDDDAVDEINYEFNAKMEREKNAMKEKVDSMEREIVELEGKLGRLRSGPSPVEALEAEKQVLEQDKQKFSDFIAKLTDGVEQMQKTLNEKEKELAMAVTEKERICKESEELKRTVGSQEIDHRVAERMRRELQAVEREIDEAESARTELEEKSWNLDEKISKQFKELEALSTRSNQALRRLKLPGDLQYVLNAKGATVVEVMGIDYKSTIKPAIMSYTDEIKKNSMANSEELLALQQQAVDLSNKIEGKKNHISELQRKIEQVEAQMASIRKQIQDYEARCKSEAENMQDAVETEARNLDMQERGAQETLKNAKLELQETEKKCEDEIQMCAYELAALIDAVSGHKEYVERKIQEMGKEISGAAEFVSEAYKHSLSLQFREAKKARTQTQVVSSDV